MIDQGFSLNSRPTSSSDSRKISPLPVFTAQHVNCSINNFTLVDSFRHSQDDCEWTCLWKDFFLPFRSWNIENKQAALLTKWTIKTVSETLSELLTVSFVAMGLRLEETSFFPKFYELIESMSVWSRRLKWSWVNTFSVFGDDAVTCH